LPAYGPKAQDALGLFARSHLMGRTSDTTRNAANNVIPPRWNGDAGDLNSWRGANVRCARREVVTCSRLGNHAELWFLGGLAEGARELEPATSMLVAADQRAPVTREGEIVRTR
jgi:hypothetical protein